MKYIVKKSLYCIFDVQNLVLCLNRELIKIIDYKIMLELQCKTTFNSVFVGVWFYMKYIVKNYSDRILLARLCVEIF
jgi:hypothetical protein